MVRLNANDIDTDRALVDEATTALTMRAILKVFGDKPTVALVLSVLLKSGRSRILSIEKVKCMLRMLLGVGVEAAWKIAVRAGFFHHIETPINPNL